MNCERKVLADTLFVVVFAVYFWCVTLQSSKKEGICQHWTQFVALAGVQLTPQKPSTAQGNAPQD